MHFIEYTNKIENYYNISDIFLFPTLREGLPNVLLESMSSGLVSVATSLPGVTDWIIKNNYNGFIFPKSYKSLSLSKLLLKIIKNKQKIGLIKKNSRRDVIFKFQPKITSKNTYKIYKDLLNKY